MEASNSGLFSASDIEERETRRKLIAQAELETSQAEKELQEWYRMRHALLPTIDFPQSPSSQNVSTRYREVVSATTSPKHEMEVRTRVKGSNEGRPPRLRHEPNLRLAPDALLSTSVCRSDARSPSPRSELEFRPPLEDPLKSLSFSRDLGVRAHCASQSPEYRILCTQADSNPVKHVREDIELNRRSTSRQQLRAENSYPHSRCISQEERDLLLSQKDSECQRLLEQQRAAIIDELCRRIKDFDSQEGCAQKTQKMTDQARVLSDQLRKPLEERLERESDKSLRQAKEIARLEQLLSAKTQEESKAVAELRLRNEALLKELEDRRNALQRLSEVRSKEGSDIEALREENSRLGAEKAALERELQARDSGQSAKELAMVKQDYEELLQAHRRALQREGPAEVRLKPSSPLKKKFESPESSLQESRELAEVRRNYERKCLDLSEEALLWKEKARKLSSKHLHALERLQRDGRQLQADLALLGAQTSQQIRDLAAIFEEKMMESDRLIEHKMSRRSHSSEKVVTTYIAKKH